MQNYEAAYYFLPTLDEGAVENLNQKFSTAIAHAGGEVAKVNNHGKKRLAYRIKAQEEGHFVILEFKGNSEIAKEFGRVLRITDEVIRSLIVRQN